MGSVGTIIPTVECVGGTTLAQADTPVLVCKQNCPYSLVEKCSSSKRASGVRLSLGVLAALAAKVVAEVEKVEALPCEGGEVDSISTGHPYIHKMDIIQNVSTF